MPDPGLESSKPYLGSIFPFSASTKKAVGSFISGKALFIILILGVIEDLIGQKHH